MAKPKIIKPKKESDLDVETWVKGQYGYAQKMQSEIAMAKIVAAIWHLEFTLVPEVERLSRDLRGLLCEVKTAIELSRPAIIKMKEKK